MNNEPEPEGQTDPEIKKIEEEVGVSLYDGDLELAKIDREHGIREYYRSVESACKAKATHAKKLPLDMPARRAWQEVLHKE